LYVQDRAPLVKVSVYDKLLEKLKSEKS